MTKIIPLIWFQERWEAVLHCLGCGDVCIYTFPIKYKISKIRCDSCGQLKMTDKIPHCELYNN